MGSVYPRVTEQPTPGIHANLNGSHHNLYQKLHFRPQLNTISNLLSHTMQERKQQNDAK